MKKSVLSDKVIREHVAIRKAMEYAALRVVEEILYRDKEGVVFQELGSLDRVREVELADVRIERDYLHRKGKPPKPIDVPRFLVRVVVEDNSRETAWIDAYLLSYEGLELTKEVTIYLERLTEPVKARRRTGELQRMKDLMNKYPAEAHDVMLNIASNQ